MASLQMYRVGSSIARRTPPFSHHVLARILGLVAASAGGSKRIVVQRNLERVLQRSLSKAEKRRLINKTFEYCARYYIESFHLPSLGAAAINKNFTTEGFDEVVAAVERKQGPILALPHLGTWEWAAWWLVLVPKFQVTAVAEPLEPPEVYEWFVGFRESLGMNIVPLGQGAGWRCMEALKDGQVVCLLNDRDIFGNGIPVEFFGERTTLSAGPATLALRTGSPLIPTAVYWQNNGRHAICLPPLDTTRRAKLRQDVARVSQELAYSFETLIRRAPEQWHMLSPNWPSDYQALNLMTPKHLQDTQSQSS